MEFYGSIDSVSGSITASLFTGSFKGDGGGLYNLPASGVTGLNLSQIASGNATASISSTGFTVNKSTQIQGDLSVTGSIVATNYIVSSSVTYMTTSFASGSSMFGNDNNDVHQFTGSVAIAGTLSLNGIAVGVGKLDETTFQSYTSSISSSIGSLSASIALTDVSQSNRLTTIEGNYATTGSNLFKGSQTISGSIIPSVDNLYDLGSSTYQWRDVYISSGSLYIDGTKVLGSTSQELTITTDTGQSIKILEAGSDSIILQSADGDIELKSSGGGDILFDPTSGLISIKGTTQIQDGFKITSSGGNSIVFGDAVIVSGSIDLTGNVDGIDLQSFSSSVSASISSLLGGNTSLSSSIATTTSNLSSSINSLSSSVSTTTSGLTSTITSLSSSLTSSIGSLSSSLATTTSGLSSSIESLSSSVATTTVGLKNRVDSIETTTGSLNTFSSSINTTIKTKLDSESIISSSIQVNITGTTGYSTFSSSVSTSIGALSSSVVTTTSGLSSSIGSLSSSVATTTSDLSSSIGSLSSSVATTTSGLSSSVATTTSGLSSSIGSLSSSVATTTSGLSSSIGSLSSSVATTTSELSSSIATTTLGTKNRVDSIEIKTGSYATTGSNIFQGTQTITGSLYISQDLIVAGSSSIQNISSSILNIADNIITVNALNPSVRFGGLAVIDSGSSPQVSGSMLFDSVNDQWIFIHQNQSSITSSILLMGPQTFNSLGSESYPTTNRILKSVNAEHAGDSNITDNGTTVTILSNTIINGTISSTGTTIVSGSSQIAHDSTTGYVANRHIDHTAVSISAGNGLSGGGDISSTRTISLDTTSATFTTGVKTKMNTDGVVSGSSQITFSGIGGVPSGLVSGSSQIDLTATTNYASGILTRLNAVGVFSGSAQVVAALPSGTVSGSAQIIAGLPSGTVSGSAQITLSSTTGYGSVLNQAVLTTSTPTFARIIQVAHTTTLSNSSYATESAFYANAAESPSTAYPGYGFHKSNVLGLYLYATNSSTLRIRGDAGTDVLIYHSGNLTNLNQLTNGPGYITGYTETDTLATVTARGASTSTALTLSGKVTFASSVSNRPQFPGGMLGLDTGDGNFDIWGISRDYYPSHATAASAWGLRWNGDNNDFEFVGGGTSRVILDMDGGNVTATGNVSATGTIGGSNYSGTHTGVSSGTNTGDETLARINALAITTVGTITSGTWNGSSISTSYTAAKVTAVNAGTGVGVDTTTGSVTVSIGQAVATSSSPTFANQVLSGRLNFGTNGTTPYNDPTGTSSGISFGGWESSSLRTYGIFTEQENVGGNYSKLTLNFHTGIRLGASSSYGGTRFYNNYAGGSGGGSEIFSVGNGDNNVRVTANLLPTINNNSNLGSASLGWANVYTNDLHLSNMNKPEGNDIDGTNGTWTIQEGAENLYIINNNNGKKYKIDLTEII